MSKTMLSPMGTAVYPSLNTPDTKFDADGVYKTDLRLDPEAGATFAAQIDELMAQSEAKALEEKGTKKVKVANPPYRIDEETGDYLFRFKTKAAGTSRRTGEKWARTVPLVDAQRQPCPGARVGGGSEIVVAFEPNLYFVAAVGAGVSLKIKAVQIVNLVEWGGNASNLFEDVDGFVANESHAEPVARSSEVEDDEADEDHEF